MSTQMNDLLIKLSQDPFLAEKFKDDPSGFLKAFDVDAGEAALLVNRDSAGLDRVLNVMGSPNGDKGKKPAKKKKKKPAKKKK